MSNQKRTVLITGCSDGGLGAALARAFNNAGFHVYATTRNVTKMAGLKAEGIETLQLDVLSPESVKKCAANIKQLDILVNNAGTQFVMPVSDLDIEEAKKTFDLNVWSYIRVIQAFLPLLIASKGIVVNQTSISSVVAVPFLSIYSASKAAMSMISDTLRLEVEPFGVKVVDLRTGLVQSNLIKNFKDKEASLPAGSIYEVARTRVEAVLRQEGFEDGGEDPDVWAKGVVSDLLLEKPPGLVWRGQQILGDLEPIYKQGLFDDVVKKAQGIDIVEQAIKEQEKH